MVPGKQGILKVKSNLSHEKFTVPIYFHSIATTDHRAVHLCVAVLEKTTLEEVVRHTTEALHFIEGENRKSATIVIARMYHLLQWYHRYVPLRGPSTVDALYLRTPNQVLDAFKTFNSAYPALHYSEQIIRFL